MKGFISRPDGLLENRQLLFRPQGVALGRAVAQEGRIKTNLFWYGPPFWVKSSESDLIDGVLFLKSASVVANI